jgi:ADP-ribosylglycohydrolase
LTHGHIDAILPAGYLAAFVACGIQGKSPAECAETALGILRRQNDHEACSEKIAGAIALAQSSEPVAKAMEKIGNGYTADEAAALAVFLTLRFKDDYDGAIVAATSFGGNTDTIPPVTGNIIGALYGTGVIPKKWTNELELVDLIKHGADLMLERVDAALLEDEDEALEAHGLYDQR